VLTSLEIRNFRAFSNLAIDRLGRVNLVVGRNNVGKTCLLEALRLYDSRGAVQVIEAILASRNEVRMDPVHERALPMLDMLFHKTSQLDTSLHLSIGPSDLSGDHPDVLTISGRDLAQGRVGHPAYARDVLSVGGLSINCGAESTEVGYEDFFSQRSTVRSPCEELPFLTAAPVSEDMMARWWDAVVLTELKDDVVNTLRSLDPSVSDIGFVAHPLDPYRRMAMVRSGGIAGPVPLRSLGDGVVRVFALATALQFRGIWSEPGEMGRALLIDEVENGIHHSFHVSLWKSLFRLARLNDVQVFATTHSWDCLRGFAEAIRLDKEADGLVIRLEKVAGRERTGAVVMDRDDLPIVVRESIEVR
jgi:hypothetical protein